ncbi:MAG: hypothetical protein AAF487_08815 [Bacteroidota bacterium]
MDKLCATWLTEGLIDFEYKKYILLAYLKNVREQYTRTKLYPMLSDLVFHHRNLMYYIETKEFLEDQFPKHLKGLDKKKVSLIYEAIIQDDDLMSEIDDLVEYSIPLIEDAVREGRELYEIIEDAMEFGAVGVLPLYNKEGYLFLSNDDSKLISIYKFAVSSLKDVNSKYHSITTTFIQRARQSVANSIDNMKTELTKQFNELPNPAAYVVNCQLSVPEEETFLPIAKRMLMRQVARA